MSITHVVLISIEMICKKGRMQIKDNYGNFQYTVVDSLLIFLTAHGFQTSQSDCLIQNFKVYANKCD